MNRSKKFNKYTLTKHDSLEERLKRSNKSPIERIAEMAEKFERANIINLKDIYDKQTLNRSEASDNSTFLTLEDIYKATYKEDNS